MPGYHVKNVSTRSVGNIIQKRIAFLLNLNARNKMLVISKFYTNRAVEKCPNFLLLATEKPRNYQNRSGVFCFETHCRCLTKVREGEKEKEIRRKKQC